MQGKLIKSLCAIVALIGLAALSNGLRAAPDSEQSLSVRPDLSGEMYALSGYININKPRMAHLKQIIAARKANLEQEAAALDSKKTKIDEARKTLDRRDRASLEAFNQYVDDYNAEHRDYQRNLDVYNNEVADYNEHAKVLNEKQRRLETLSDLASTR